MMADRKAWWYESRSIVGGGDDYVRFAVSGAEDDLIVARVEGGGGVGMGRLGDFLNEWQGDFGTAVDGINIDGAGGTKGDGKFDVALGGEEMDVLGDGVIGFDGDVAVVIGDADGCGGIVDGDIAVGGLDADAGEVGCLNVEIDPLVLGEGVGGSGGDDPGWLTGVAVVVGEGHLVTDVIERIVERRIDLDVGLDLIQTIDTSMEGALDLDLGQGGIFGDGDGSAEDVDIEEDWLGGIEGRGIEGVGGGCVGTTAVECDEGDDEDQQEWAVGCGHGGEFG